ncbi:Protein transport protein S9 plasma membrane t-SNARE [Serendipita sp. 398]|nr:Protein transport protein S9 plasma membrane t-SNARE [Serendipita sp. 398]
MSWFKKKETPGARTPEPQYDPYARRPGEENIPDEYESNRNALLGPAAGSGGRRPSPAPDHNGYRSAAPQRNRYDVREDEEEGSYRSGNTLRKAGPPPSAQAIAREANSIRAMPDRVARSGPNDQYSRGARDLDRDRNALFSGATVNPRASGGNNRYDEQRGGAGEEDEEEDLEAIQKKTKDTKQASVNSTRDALRMMRETEETGRSTLMKLGAQSEQLASTERHLQVSKGYIRRADDNTADIKTLNRSIFIPAITFDKTKKRTKEEERLAKRYEEERAEREANLAGVRATRRNRDGPPGEDDDESLGGGGRYGAPTAARKAQWSKYQTRDDDEEDDAMEDEISNNLNELSMGIGRIRALADAQGEEVKRQNAQLKRLHGVVEDVDQKLTNSTERMRRL